MKNIRNLFTLSVLSVIMMFMIQGCSQYPDNEGVSWLSKTDRLSGTWNVENYKVNGTDLTSIVSGYSETFNTKGGYSFQWAILGGTGTWKFQNGFSEIKISDVNNVIPRTLFILKLEENSFWYYYMDGDTKKEYHLVAE